MLNYYGSTVGLDMSPVIGGSKGSSYKSLSHTESSLERTRINYAESENDEPRMPVLAKGTPIVVSDFLATSWQLKDMQVLAGNEQHDSHEFMQVLLDIVDKDCKRFQRSISLSRENAMRESSIKWADDTMRQSKLPGEFYTQLFLLFQWTSLIYYRNPCTGSVTSLFTGNLRSVLMCDACGFKRKHIEPFINISLSLPENKGGANPLYKSYNDHTMGTRRRGQKIDVRTW